MRQESRPGVSGALDRKSLERTGEDLERRTPVALGLYGVLAALVWFTMGGGKVLVFGKMVEMRWIPLLILGGLVLRTVLALQAEKIRRRGDGDGSRASRS